MINQRLYDVLDRLHIACSNPAVLGAGSEPLQDAWNEATLLLNEIDNQPKIIDALSAAIGFISGCQTGEADELASMLADVLNSLRGDNQRR